MSLEQNGWDEALLSELRSMGRVEERDPFGLVVYLDKGEGMPVVEVLMTPDDWSDMLAIHGWDSARLAQMVGQNVKETSTRRLFCHNYVLEQWDEVAYREWVTQNPGVEQRRAAER